MLCAGFTWSLHSPVRLLTNTNRRRGSIPPRLLDELQGSRANELVHSEREKLKNDLLLTQIMVLGEVKTDVHTVVELVEGSSEFQEFNSANPHHYLVHAFCTAEARPGAIELGYYGKEHDKITIFKTNPIAAMPPEEVFKEQGILEPLDLPAVRIGLSEALAKAEQERTASYPRHATMKTICVLQQKGQPLWNLTLVTATMQMINMRIDAMTGQVISREMHSIMSIARE